MREVIYRLVTQNYPTSQPEENLTPLEFNPRHNYVIPSSQNVERSELCSDRSTFWENRPQWTLAFFRNDPFQP
jgi:hypothetical protein